MSDARRGRRHGTGARLLMRTYAEPPATFVRGEGTVLFDAVVEPVNMFFRL